MFSTSQNFSLNDDDDDDDIIDDYITPDKQFSDEYGSYFNKFSRQNADESCDKLRSKISMRQDGTLYK